MKKTTWVLTLSLLIFLSACTPISKESTCEEDPSQDKCIIEETFCEKNPNHEDCIVPEVDCDATPEHEDCIVPIVDCDATPEHEDCIVPVVDCDATPEHEDCIVPVVDCDATPEHEECTIEDIIAPVITLHLETITIFKGDPLPDLTTLFSIYDDVDGDISSELANVDLSLIDFDSLGDYFIRLSVTDQSGNEAMATINLSILKKPFVPLTKETDPDDGIVYFITKNDLSPRYSFFTAVRAIQGIVNRFQPNLMFIDTNNTYYTHTDVTWMDNLEKEGYELRKLNSFDEVAMTFQHYFSHLIEIDDQIKSYNNWVSTDADFGAMMTSITTYMPVPKGATTRIAGKTELELVEMFDVNGIEIDGRINSFLLAQGLTTPYAIYNYTFETFRDQFNTKSFMSLTSEAMDYAVRERMMFFDLKPSTYPIDKDLFTRINAYFGEINDFFHLYGWVDQEGSGLNFVSSYGGMINCVGTGNLSLYASVPVDYEFKQKSTFVSSYDPNLKYVTFLASEGDTIKAPTTFQQGSWLDPMRGSVPINWGVIGYTVLEFPFVAKYFYETMTENDYFFSGGASSIGFVDIDTQMPHKTVVALAEINRMILEASDQKYVDTYNDLFAFGDSFNPTYLGEYLIDSGYTGAYGINPWESTGPIYMSDMLFYNRKAVFYPRAATSNYVKLSDMQAENNNRYNQTRTSSYWYIKTELNRTINSKVEIDLFIQPNGDKYIFEIIDGKVSIYKSIGGDRTLIGLAFYSMIGKKNLIVAIDRSSSIMTHTTIAVYVDKQRIIKLTDETFGNGSFSLYSEEGVVGTFQSLQGKHLSQADEIYYKILNDPRKFIVGYYGVVFAKDFTESQYRVEPGPGEVISMSPTDFFKIQVKLNETHPGQYAIVNMDEFYTYLKQSIPS